MLFLEVYNVIYHQKANQILHVKHFKLTWRKLSCDVIREVHTLTKLTRKEKNCKNSDFDSQYLLEYKSNKLETSQ